MNSLIKPALTFLVLSCFITQALADEQTAEQQASPAPVCESKENFKHFDFWLGEWNVYSNDDKRQFQGTNSVTKQHKNCLIMENWTNVQGGTGSSMNYYDPVEDRWRQLWVADGYSIDYSGGLNESRSMVLKGKINYYQTGKSQAFRGTFTPNADGTVRQFFEQKDAESQKWAVWFDGLYVKTGSE